jgi:hypothetical protein
VLEPVTKCAGCAVPAGAAACALALLACSCTWLHASSHYRDVPHCRFICAWRMLGLWLHSYYSSVTARCLDHGVVEMLWISDCTTVLVVCNRSCLVAPADATVRFHKPYAGCAVKREPTCAVQRLPADARLTLAAAAGRCIMHACIGDV